MTNDEIKESLKANRLSIIKASEDLVSKVDRAELLVESKRNNYQDEVLRRHGLDLEGKAVKTSIDNLSEQLDGVVKNYLSFAEGFESRVEFIGKNIVDNSLVELKTEIKQTYEEIRLSAERVTQELDGKITESNAQLSIRAEEIRATVTKNIENSLKGRFEQNETMISQTAQEVRLKADKTVVDHLRNSVVNSQSSLSIMSDKIESKVSRAELNTITGELMQTNTRITQTNAMIELMAGSVSSGADGRLTVLESKMTLIPGQIALLATKSEVNAGFNSVNLTLNAIEGSLSSKVESVDYNGETLVSMINQTAGSITIQANKINLDGQVTFNSLNPDLQGQLSKGEDADNYIKNTLPDILDDISEQLDGLLEQHFETYDPTPSNLPASEWTTTELKTEHLGDLFYNTATGKSWRWVKEGGNFLWKEIINADLTAALEAASKAQDTADSKRRVFTVTPFPPYDIGDMWLQGDNGDIMRATVKKTATQSYSSSDWIKASKYTDDSAAIAHANQVKLDLQGEVNDVYTAIGDLENTLNDSFKDGIISNAEAKAIQTHIQTLDTEKADVQAKTTAILLNNNLPVANNTTVDTAWNTYNTAHLDLIVEINNAIADGEVTPEESNAINSRFNAYRNALSTLTTRLEDAVDAIAKKIADDAKQAAIVEAERKRRIQPIANGMRFVDIISWANTSSSVAGNIVIRTQIESSKMTKLKISGYDYTANQSGIDLDVEFYITGAAISRLRYQSNGTCPIGEVHVGVDSAGKAVVIITRASGNWSYPKIQVDWAILTHSTVAPESWINGWSIDLFVGAPTAVPGLTGIVKASGRDMNIFADDLFNKTGIGSLPSGKTIITGGQITTDLLNVSQVRSTIVTAAYINTLALEASSLKVGSAAATAVAKAKTDAVAESKQYMSEFYVDETQLNSTIGSISIGGRNLIKDSGKTISNSNYQIANLPLTERLQHNEQITITIWGVLAPTRSSFRAYNTGGNVSVGTLDLVEAPSSANGNIGIYRYQGTWKHTTSANTHLTIYQFTSAQTGSSTISRIQLERGHRRSDWTPAPEDTETSISGVSSAVTSLDTYVKGTAFKDGIVSSAEAKAIEKYLNAIKAEKNDIDSKYNAIYAVTDLTGTPKTNLSSAKTAFNTAYTNLTNSINTAVSGGTVTPAQKTDVDNKFTAYATALGTLAQRFEQAQDAITAKRKTDAIAGGTAGGVSYFNTNIVQRDEAINLRATKTELQALEAKSGNLLNNITLTGVKDLPNKTGWSATGLSVVNRSFQGLSVPVLQSSSVADIQNYSTWFDVDPAKAYEFSLWLQCSSTVGIFYIGIRAAGKNSTAEIPITSVSSSGVLGTTATNKYFRSGTAKHTAWRRYVGYVMPSGTDPSSMAGISENMTNNMIMEPNTAQIRVRFLNYTNGTTAQQVWVANPKFVEVDASAVGRISKAQADITVQAGQISSKVSSSDYTGTKVVSLINQTASSVKIEAKNINLSGAVTVTDLANGAVTEAKIATNAVSAAKILSGAVTAVKISDGAVTANKVAANAINASKIVSGSITTTQLNVSNVQAGIVTAARVNALAITSLGAVTAGSFNLGSGRFRVDTAGNLTASSVNLSGTINATAGKIGGFTISGDQLINASTATSLLFNNISGSGFLRINQASNSPVLEVRTDLTARTGVYVQTYGNDCNGIYVVSNSPGASGRALRAYGNIDLVTRGGIEKWNAPGALGCWTISNTGVWRGGWTIPTIILNTQMLSGGIVRFTHNLGHQVYWLCPVLMGGSGSVYITSWTANYVEVRLDTSHDVSFIMMGLNSKTLF